MSAQVVLSAYLDLASWDSCTSAVWPYTWLNCPEQQSQHGGLEQLSQHGGLEQLSQHGGKEQLSQYGG